MWTNEFNENNNIYKKHDQLFVVTIDDNDLVAHIENERSVKQNYDMHNMLTTFSSSILFEKKPK